MRAIARAWVRRRTLRFFGSLGAPALVLATVFFGDPPLVRRPVARPTAVGHFGPTLRPLDMN